MEKEKTVAWDEGEQVWMKAMNHLLTMMFGNDYFVYEYNEKKVCIVADDSKPTFKYSMEEWNEEYPNMISERTSLNAKGNYIHFFLTRPSMLHVTIAEGLHVTGGISWSILFS